MKGFWSMKFDVIIGNPPYQLSSNKSGIQAVPLYDKFVEQAMKLSPNYLLMIIPSRWYSGGMGMANFRNNMLNDCRLQVLVDYPKSRDCFPGVDIAGGVCYFLWNKNYCGPCEITNRQGNLVEIRTRQLNEYDILIRDNVGIDIVRKVSKKTKRMLSSVVSPISPFGLPTSKRGKKKAFENSIKLISSAGVSFISRDEVEKNKDVIDSYKVAVGQLNPDRGGVNNASDGKMNVITKIRIYEPGEVFTATYLLLGHFSTLVEAESYASYIKTMLVRFLISLTLSSMHITKDSFRFVPTPRLNSQITDEALYELYCLDENEIKYIESMIRPME